MTSESNIVSLYKRQMFDSQSQTINLRIFDLLDRELINV